MGKLMVKSQFNLCWSWLTSKNGWPPRMWKMVSPMNCMVFNPQDLNPGQSSKCFLSRTTKKQPIIRFPVIWSDLFCLFPWQKSGTHKMTYPIHSSIHLRAPTSWCYLGSPPWPSSVPRGRADLQRWSEQRRSWKAAAWDGPRFVTKLWKTLRVKCDFGL